MERPARSAVSEGGMTDVATPSLVVGCELPVGSPNSWEDTRGGEGFATLLEREFGGMIGGGEGLDDAPLERATEFKELVLFPTRPQLNFWRLAALAGVALVFSACCLFMASAFVVALAAS